MCVSVDLKAKGGMRDLLEKSLCGAELWVRRGRQWSLESLWQGTVWNGLQLGQEYNNMLSLW